MTYTWDNKTFAARTNSEFVKRPVLHIVFVDYGVPADYQILILFLTNVFLSVCYHEFFFCNFKNNKQRKTEFQCERAVEMKGRSTNESQNVYGKSKCRASRQRQQPVYHNVPFFRTRGRIYHFHSGQPPLDCSFCCSIYHHKDLPLHLQEILMPLDCYENKYQHLEW